MGGEGRVEGREEGRGGKRAGEVSESAAWWQEQRAFLQRNFSLKWSEVTC